MKEPYICIECEYINDYDEKDFKKNKHYLCPQCGGGESDCYVCHGLNIYICETCLRMKFEDAGPLKSKLLAVPNSVKFIKSLKRKR